MKKTILPLLIVAILGFAGMAQVPGAFSYQAVVRNNTGAVVANHDVSFRISILQDSESGSAVYTETHDVTTNAFGLANLKIGSGTAVNGTFSPNGWGTAPHFIKIELDANGGSSYTHLSTTQLLAVPYAFHAQTVENDKVNDADADATNELQTMSISGTELTLSNGGGTIVLPSAGEGGDNWGTQKVVSNETLTGEGTTASPLSVNGSLGEAQTLAISGNQLTISNGNSVEIPKQHWDEGNGGIATTQRVGIGGFPSNRRQLDMYANNNVGIWVTNTSDLPSIVVTNRGTGPAAQFKNEIYIIDGTQGEGKILTSDAYGKTSWQRPAAAQTLSVHGNELTISDGNSVTLPARDDAQTLSLDGNELTISEGNTVTLPAGDESPWTTGSTGITYHDGAVGLGTSTNVSAKLHIESAASAIRAKNNTQGFPTIHVENESGGYAALFHGKIRIKDGTQAQGKVLTCTDGGDASWQAQMTPLAYGTIHHDGNPAKKSGNVSVSKTATGEYTISISGESYIYSSYVTVVSLVHSIGFIKHESKDGKLKIFTFDTSGNAADKKFTFVVYKP